MKKILFSAAALSVVGLIAFTRLGRPDRGASLPEAEVRMNSAVSNEVNLKNIPQASVRMKDVSGAEVSLMDAVKGNGLLLMFSCNTCPYVVKNQGRTIESARYALGRDIGVILVNSNEGQRDGDDSYEAMQAYAKEQGYTWHYAVDKNSALADAFGAKRTPECLLFDQEGRLVYHGAIDDNPTDEDAVGRKHLREAMDELLGGKAVSVPASRSVGCNIKRL